MRLFFAVNLNGEAKDRAEEMLRELKRQGVRGRFTERDNLHLTLAFLGETERLAEAVSAAEKVCCEPFKLTFGGIGRLARSGILWLGVSQNGVLQHLQTELSAELRQSGFRLEDRPYSPHLTLAREAVLPQNADLSQYGGGCIALPVDTFELMRSDRINGRLCYRVVKSFPVKKREKCYTNRVTICERKDSDGEIHTLREALEEKTTGTGRTPPRHLGRAVPGDAKTTGSKGIRP